MAASKSNYLPVETHALFDFGVLLLLTALFAAMAWPSSASAQADVNCDGGLRVHFLDVALQTTIGFDDRTVVSTGSLTLGKIRRDTVCAVFDYLANDVINLNGATPDVLVEVSETDGQGPLGTGNSFFPNPPAPGLIGGTLHSHITTGIDPTPGDDQFDMRMEIDFGARGIGSNDVPYHNDHTTPSFGRIDLFSVVLHETMHALGFGSLITAVGSSGVGGAYALYDDFLEDGGLFPLIDASFNFQLTPNDLLSNALDYFGPSSSKRLSLYSPSVFQPGSSLSHFDDQRDGMQYVMRPATSGGDDRVLTFAELNALCDLGYTLHGGVCSNRYPVGVDDDDLTINITTPGEGICIDVLANDSDPDNDPIAIDPDSVQIGTGGGSVVISSNEICYTPSSVFCGTALISYAPSDGQRIGNPARVLVDTQCSFCPENACNLICNGGFESGAKKNRFGSLLNLNALDCNAVPAVDSWCSVVGSADLFIRGYPNASIGIPQNNFADPAGVDSWNGIGNDRYVGFRALNSAIEGVYTPLVKNLTQGRPYELSFYVRPSNSTFLRNPPGPVGLVAFLNSNQPSTHPTDQNGVYDREIYRTKSNVLFPPGPPWHLVTQPFSPITSDRSFLIIEPIFTQQSNGTYVYIDDIAIRDSTVLNIDIAKTVDDEIPRLGQTINYTIDVCNEGDLPTGSVTIEDVLPPGLTFVSGFDDYPQHTFNDIAAGSCATVTLTAIVDNTARRNAPLTNCTALVSSGSVCQSFSQSNHCIDVTIPATDIHIAKTVSDPTPLHQEDVTFMVTVSNLGAADAHNVVVNDTVPGEFNYLSHVISDLTATYDPVSGNLLIPMLAANASITLEITVASVGDTCTEIENTAELISIDETDINTTNNKAAVSVNIGPCCIAPPSNMVAWWPFDETTGTVALNRIAGNHGNHINGPIPVPGLVADALEFDGANRVAVPHSDLFNLGAGDITIDAWVYPTSNTGGVIVEKRNVSSGDGFVFSIADSSVSFSMQEGSNIFSISTGPNEVPMNEWTHVAVIVRQSPSQIDANIIANPLSGPSSNQFAGTSTQPRVNTNTPAGLSIGTQFVGMIDELEIFNHALTGGEVHDIYKAGRHGKCKETLHVDWDTPFCANRDSVVVTTTVCNYTSLAQRFNLSFQGRPSGSKGPGGGCGIAGPTNFTPIDSLPVVVQPGVCAPIRIKIARPDGLTTSGQVACYRVSAIAQETGFRFSTLGSLQATNDWCPAEPGPGFPQPTGGILSLSFDIANTGALDGIFDFEIQVMVPDENLENHVVSINGQPPGTNVVGSIEIPVGDSATIPFIVEFIVGDPFGIYDIVLLTDLNGDGTKEPVLSTAVRFVSEEVAVPCDPGTPGAIIGTPGDDRLIGTSGNDVIIGLEGNDTIIGRGGNDCIDGGPGEDRITSGSGGDRIIGGAGNDDITAGSGHDEIDGGAGDDHIVGGSGNDRIFGSSGNDDIMGGSGNDEIDSGLGDDQIIGGSGVDTCVNGEFIARCE